MSLSRGTPSRKELEQRKLEKQLKAERLDALEATFDDTISKVSAIPDGGRVKPQWLQDHAKLLVSFAKFNERPWKHEDELSVYSNYFRDVYISLPNDEQASEFYDLFKDKTGLPLDKYLDDLQADLRGRELDRHNAELERQREAKRQQEAERQRQLEAHQAEQKARADRATFFKSLEADVSRYNEDFKTEIEKSKSLLSQSKTMLKFAAQAISDKTITQDKLVNFDKTLKRELDASLDAICLNLISRFEIGRYAESLESRSVSTSKQYQRAFDMLFKKMSDQGLDHIPLVYELDGGNKTMSKSQARIHKAAFNDQVFAMLNRDSVHKMSDKQRAAWIENNQEHLNLIRNTYIKFPYAVPFAPTGHNDPMKYSAVAVNDNREIADARRLNLHSLPGNWSMTLIEAMPKSQQVYGYIGSTFGLRPQELKNGVEITETDNSLICKIETVKRKADVEDARFRLIEVQKDHPHSLKIRAEMKSKSHNFVANTGYQRGIKRAAEKTNIDVTHYSFRHQFACNCVADGLGKETTSKALGHLSAGTLKHYYSASVPSTNTPSVMSVHTAAA